MTKCPKCGSSNIKTPKYTSHMIFGNLFENLCYACECGFEVNVPPLDQQRRDAAEERGSKEEK